MRLFVNLYLDEDVSNLIAALARSRGIVVLTTQEAGEIGQSDETQLATAARRQMAILTHNRNDFLKLAEQYRQDGRHHSGIIIAIRRSPAALMVKLLYLLDEVSADEMDDQVYFI